MASNDVSRTFPAVFKFKKTANLYLKMLHLTLTLIHALASMYHFNNGQLAVAIVTKTKH